MKRRRERLRECTTAAIMAVSVFLLAARVVSIAAQAETERLLNELDSSTAIHLTETYSWSTKSDIAVCETEELTETAEVNDNTDITEEASEIPHTAITEQAPAEWIYPLTEREVRLVALVAEREDRGAMREIAETILNRIKSGKFPDSVTEVIYQPKQFYAAGGITAEMNPCDEAVEAVTAVFRDGYSSVGGALFFAEISVPPHKIANGLFLTETAGETNFYEQK